MRLGMRVLFVLAVPGIVFGSLTRVPPISFNMDFDFFANEVGWIDVLAALVLAIAVVSFGAIVVAVLVKLGVAMTRTAAAEPRGRSLRQGRRFRRFGHAGSTRQATSPCANRVADGQDEPLSAAGAHESGQRTGFVTPGRTQRDNDLTSPFWTLSRVYGPIPSRRVTRTSNVAPLRSRTRLT